MSGFRFTLGLPLVVGLWSISLISNVSAQDGDFEKLTADLKRVESSFESLWMRGKWSTQTWDSESQSLRPMPDDWFIAAYVGTTGTRSYVARNTAAARPEDSPPTNWMIRGTSIYDGRAGLQIYDNSGRGEEESPYATVANGVPGEIKDWLWTASLWRITQIGVGSLERQGFSEIVNQGRNRERLPLKVGREVFEGRDAVYVRVDDGHSRRTLYFDPARSHAIVAMILEKMGATRVAYRALELREIAPGLFYPVRGERRSWSPEGHPSEVGVLEVAELHANDPAKIAGLLDLRVEKGVTVFDSIADLSVGSGHSAETLRTELRHEAARIRAASNPGSDSSILVLELPPHRRSELAAPSPTDVRKLAGIGLVGLSVAGLGFLLARQRMQKARVVPSVFALALVVVGGSRLPAQDVPPGLGALKEFRAHSCGLNACGLVLELFELPFDIDTGVAALDIGPVWDRPASLLNMVRFLTSNGLSVRSLKSEGIDAAADQILEGQRVIIHMKGGAFGAGHYFVLAARWEDKYLVAVPGHGLAWVTLERLKVQYGPYFSGHFVVISRPKPVEERKDVWKVSENSIQVALIAARQEKGELRIPVDLINDSGEDLIYKNAFGSCACFAGVAPAGDSPKLPAGSVTQLVISYNKEKLQLGFNQQQVRVELVGSTSRELTFHLEFHVTEPAAADRIAVFPDSLDFRAVDQTTQTVSLVIPATVRIEELTTSDGDLIVEAVSSGAASWEREAAPRRVHQFRVSIRGERRGDQARWIAIGLSSGDLRRLEIPVYH